MSEKNQNLLSSFMKKQINKKSIIGHGSEKVSDKNFAQESSKKKDDKEESDEEKKLAEAKKLSSAKAAQRDQSEMIKKLIIESSVKYAVAILALVIFAISAIEFSPIFFQFLKGLFHQFFLNALTK